MVGIYDDPNRFRKKEKIEAQPESKKIMPRPLDKAGKTATKSGAFNIPKRKRFDVPYGSEDDNWMTSYSDMMTLLFAFFAMLLAMSQIDPVKMESFPNR